MSFRKYGIPSSSGKHFSLPTEDIEGDCFTACRTLLGRIWELNAQTFEAIAQLRKGLELSADTYFTVHIRRGDKNSEADTFSIHEYMRLAETRAKLANAQHVSL